MCENCDRFKDEVMRKLDDNPREALEMLMEVVEVASMFEQIQKRGVRTPNELMDAMEEFGRPVTCPRCDGAEESKGVSKWDGETRICKHCEQAEDDILATSLLFDEDPGPLLHPQSGWVALPMFQAFELV